MSSVSLEIENAKAFSDLVAITEAADSALLFIHDGNGVKKITAGNLKADLKALIEANTELLDRLTYPGAGAHNGIYRGKNLGTSVTAAQYAKIADGSFDDLYIGDYWVINNVTYRIAAFDYYLTTGDTACNTHHVVLVPDSKLYDAKMNDTNTTNGGYTGSAMYTTNLATAKTTINAAFANHILSHRQYLTNAVSNGRPSGSAWFDSDVELMSEYNVYGNGFFSPVSDGSNVPNKYSIDKSQFPLFAMRPDLISNRVTYWLRDVVSASTFACVDDDGRASDHDASYSFGVRPAFCIKG